MRTKKELTFKKKIGDDGMSREIEQVEERTFVFLSRSRDETFKSKHRHHQGPKRFVAEKKGTDKKER